MRILTAIVFACFIWEGTGLADSITPTAAPVQKDQPTEVIILAALHAFHETNVHYGREVLVKLIGACNPQAILVELPATKGGKPTVENGLLIKEYADYHEFRACQEAAQKLKIQIHPFDMDRLDEIRQEQSYWQRNRQANKEIQKLVESSATNEYSELKALKRFDEHLEKAVITFAEKGTPEIINSEALDSAMRAGRQLQVLTDSALERLVQTNSEYKKLLGELQFIRHEWEYRNAMMSENIAACAKTYAGKRIVVVVGAEHRNLLRDSLQNKNGIILKEYWELH